MTKSDYFQKKTLNSADELRELLDSLESSQPNLKALSSLKALRVLQDLDQVYVLFTQLEATDLNLLSEQSRFNAIQTYFEQNAAKFLKRLGGAVALDKHRPQPVPNREQWWWYIHETVTAQKQRLLRRVVMGLIIFSVIVGAIVLAFNTILAPSPEVVARVEAENAALTAFDVGNYESALAAVEQGLAIVPDDSKLLILKGIFQELLGQESTAINSFEQVKGNFNALSRFHVNRGQMYFRTGQYIKAEEDTMAAIALDENLSTAWLLLGQSLESQGKTFEALSAYERASNIALANGDSEVVVLARMAMGWIGIGVSPVETPVE